MFVKIIWVLLILSEIAEITSLILYARLENLEHDHNKIGYADLWPSYVVSWTITLALVSGAHWMFAI